MGEPEKSGKRLPVFPVLIVLLLLGLAVFGDKGLVKVIKLNGHRASLELEVARLEQVRDELHQEIEALNSDHRYLERLARRELGMVKDDELVYQFSSAPSPPGAKPASR